MKIISNHVSIGCRPLSSLYRPRIWGIDKLLSSKIYSQMYMSYQTNQFHDAKPKILESSDCNTRLENLLQNTRKDLETGRNIDLKSFLSVISKSENTISQLRIQYSANLTLKLVEHLASLKDSGMNIIHDLKLFRSIVCQQNAYGRPLFHVDLTCFHKIIQLLSTLNQNIEIMTWYQAISEKRVYPLILDTDVYEAFINLLLHKNRSDLLHFLLIDIEINRVSLTHRAMSTLLQLFSQKPDVYYKQAMRLVSSQYKNSIELMSTCIDIDEDKTRTVYIKKDAIIELQQVFCILFKSCQFQCISSLWDDLCNSLIAHYSVDMPRDVITRCPTPTKFLKYLGYSLLSDGDINRLMDLLIHSMKPLSFSFDYYRNHVVNDDERGVETDVVRDEYSWHSKVDEINESDDRRHRVNRLETQGSYSLIEDLIDRIDAILSNEDVNVCIHPFLAVGPSVQSLTSFKGYDSDSGIAHVKQNANSDEDVSAYNTSDSSSSHTRINREQLFEAYQVYLTPEMIGLTLFCLFYHGKSRLSKDIWIDVIKVQLSDDVRVYSRDVDGSISTHHIDTSHQYKIDYIKSALLVPYEGLQVLSHMNASRSSRHGADRVRLDGNDVFTSENQRRTIMARYRKSIKRFSKDILVDSNINRQLVNPLMNNDAIRGDTQDFFNDIEDLLDADTGKSGVVNNIIFGSNLHLIQSVLSHLTEHDIVLLSDCFKTIDTRLIMKLFDVIKRNNISVSVSVFTVMIDTVYEYNRQVLTDVKQESNRLNKTILVDNFNDRIIEMFYYMFERIPNKQTRQTDKKPIQSTASVLTQFPRPELRLRSIIKTLKHEQRYQKLILLISRDVFTKQVVLSIDDAALAMTVLIELKSYKESIDFFYETLRMNKPGQSAETQELMETTHRLSDSRLNSLLNDALIACAKTRRSREALQVFGWMLTHITTLRLAQYQHGK